MRSPGGLCLSHCNLLKNSVTSGVVLKVNNVYLDANLYLNVLVDLTGVKTFMHKVFI